MVRHLLVYGFAERERAIADGTLTAHDWDEAATAMADAITGLLRAPVTRGR